jgi:phospholipase/carboxylesterase
MPEIQAHWRTDRPVEGFRSSFLASHPDRPVRTFLPTDYQPRYPYPLVVIFHGHGGNEEQAGRLAPQISRRNFISIALRGSQTVERRVDGRPGFGWGNESAVEDYLIAAVEETRRAYHVHSERVYLLGLNEGAEVAFRVGLALADRIAGIVSLNGRMPRSAGTPLLQMNQVRRLPVLMGHGTDNPMVPLADARKDYRLLYAAGAAVRFLSYPTTHRLHPNMLRDVNAWIIGRVNKESGTPVFVD